MVSVFVILQRHELVPKIERGGAPGNPKGLATVHHGILGNRPNRRVHSQCAGVRMLRQQLFELGLDLP
jgi:hypothetical protein